MRKRNFHLAIIVGSILILSLGLSSCSTSKKSAIACPDIPLNKGYKLSSNHKNNNLLAINRTKPVRHPKSSSGKNPSLDKGLFNNSNLTDFSKVSGIENIQYQNTHELSELMIASTDNKLILPSVTTAITPFETVERIYQQVRCHSMASCPLFEKMIKTYNT